MGKRQVSGREVAQILMRHFGFVFVTQRGSHMKLRAVRQGKTVTTIIPDHRELARGTLKGVLRLAHVDESDFWKAQEK